MEDDVLWAEQYDKSDTDSEVEGDNMYDDFGVLNQYFSASYTQVWLQGGLLVLKLGESYTWVYTVVRVKMPVGNSAKQQWAALNKHFLPNRWNIGRWNVADLKITDNFG